MKILIVNTFYYPYNVGGSEAMVKLLAESLQKNKHEVFVLCTGEEDCREDINSVTVYRMRIANLYQLQNKNKNRLAKILFHLLDIYNVFNKKKIEKVISEIRPDIIHFNNNYGISPIAWKIAHNFRIPSLLSIHDIFFACPKATILRRNTNHHCGQPTYLCKYFINTMIYLTKYIQYFTVPSKITLEIFKGRGYFKNKDVEIVNNAVDFNITELKNLYEEKKLKYFEKKVVKFCFLGRLLQSKGLDLLVQAFSTIENDNIELHIAGWGALEDLVLDYTKIDKRIKFYGTLVNKQKEEFLKKCDVLIIPSRIFETFGITILEAFQYCMPVIGSNVGAIPEIVENGKDGIIIDSNSKYELIKAINYFTDKDNIITCLDNVYSKITNYSASKYVQKFEKIYKNLAISKENNFQFDTYNIEK